ILPLSISRALGSSSWRCRAPSAFRAAPRDGLDGRGQAVEFRGFLGPLSVIERPGTVPKAKSPTKAALAPRKGSVADGAISENNSEKEGEPKTDQIAEWRNDRAVFWSAIDEIESVDRVEGKKAEQNGVGGELSLLH